MYELALWMTNGRTAYLLSGLIVLWAVIVFWRFKQRLRPLAKELAELHQLLVGTETPGDFAAKFSELNERFGSSRLLGSQWREFRETLLLPEGDESPVISNSVSAGAFFSRDDLLSPHLNLRLYNAFPNLLTGSGILGTFVGLVAGIYLVGSGLSDPDRAEASLKSLLSGASLVFLTSIAGLVSSIAPCSR